MRSKIQICTIVSLLFFLITPYVSADQGDWLVRLRGIGIVPDDSSTSISLGGTELVGSGVEVDSAIVPELDITYMVTDHIGVEIIAGIANHDVNLTGPGAALGGLGLTDGFKLFDTWVLPPTVTAQYHFMPSNNIRPYIGFGVNYTATLWDDATDSLEAAVGPVNVNSTNSWGWAAQAGVDIDWKNNWYFNIDLKYIDFDSQASLETTPGTLRVDVDIDPFVIGAGIGYRFD